MLGAVAIPAHIARDHVLQALRVLDGGAPHPFGESTKFVVPMELTRMLGSIGGMTDGSN